MLLRKWLWRWTVCLGATGVFAGCSDSPGKLHYLGDADLNYYKKSATRVDYTRVKHETPPEVLTTDEPRVVGDRRKDEIYDITLFEVLQTALQNNRIIRTTGQFLSPGNALYSNPNNTPSVYDPAIQESGVLFGGRGVEAALADFDATFTTSMVWSRDENISNVQNSGLGPAPTIQTDTGAFRSRIAKQNAYGGTMAVNHNWDYLFSNAPGRLYPSAYTGVLSADYRQPLWAGSGVEFTRIAGPSNPNFAAVTGVSQGVLIARINQDIAIADFEAQVRNMLKDVEDLYWDLYLAYRNYDTAVATRNSTLRTWREEKLKLSVGKGDPSDEAQARDAYFQARSIVDTTLGDIYSRELALRRMIGMPVNDCRVLRPKDEPSSAEFYADWCESLAEALTRRVELRRQKWNIKSLELQLVAARSLTNPKLDFVSQYRVNGFGDDLLGDTDDDRTNQGLASGYGTLANGNQTGWNLGFEFSMPIGFRSAHTQVRNIELRLVKAREVLSVQELEISHEIAAAFQAIAVQYANAKMNFNRRVAAEERVRLFSERERVGTVTTDLVLRAQRSLAEAEIAYFTSLINYNKSLTDFYFRKGTLLEHNNVRIAEDRWSPAAYKEALRRAWARSHALPNPLLNTDPPEFATPLPERPPIAGKGTVLLEEEPRETDPVSDEIRRKQREKQNDLPIPPEPPAPKLLPEAPKEPSAGARRQKSLMETMRPSGTAIQERESIRGGIRGVGYDELDDELSGPLTRKTPSKPSRTVPGVAPTRSTDWMDSPAPPRSGVTKSRSREPILGLDELEPSDKPKKKSFGELIRQEFDGSTDEMLDELDKDL